MLSLLTVGASGPTTASTDSRMSVNVGLLAGQDIKIGLLNPQFTGAGFMQLRMQVIGDQGMIVDQTFDSLTAALADVLSKPAGLAAMSAGARSVALPDAAERLADLVEATAYAG